jgi:tetratricopeptide (TPR) repeat protein
VDKTGKDLFDLGVGCEADGKFAAAFDYFRRAAKAAPQAAAPYLGLSRILLRNQQRADAIACLRRAVACEPRDPGNHRLLGFILSQHGDLDAARGSFEAALALAPCDADALLGLASIAADAGRKEEAASNYERILEIEPRHVKALAGLLSVAEGGVLGAAVTRAEAQLGVCGDHDAALLGYALGKARSHQGLHGEAFGAWLAANHARRREAGAYNREHADEEVDRLLEVFSADFFEARSGWGTRSGRPVFIVGLPRAGTTLIEQILAGHPQIHAVGELNALADLATGTPDRLARHELSWPQTATELSAQQASHVAEAYLDRSTAPEGSCALRTVDKHPLNFWYLGLVALALPDARIIHCRRDIRDNALSIFAEDFTPEQRWSTDLADIAHYWRGSRRIVDHWRQVTQLAFLDVDYEETVANLPGQARQLLDFLDLPWDPCVLDFHKVSRSIQTPSRWQVRQPIYTGSVGRWRRHASDLASLFEAAGV